MNQPTNQPTTKQPRVYACDPCKYETTDKGNYNKHCMRIYHNQNVESAEPEPEQSPDIEPDSEDYESLCKICCVHEPQFICKTCHTDMCLTCIMSYVLEQSEKNSGALEKFKRKLLHAGLESQDALDIISDAKVVKRKNCVCPYCKQCVGSENAGDPEVMKERSARVEAYTKYNETKTEQSNTDRITQAKRGARAMAKKRRGG